MTMSIGGIIGVGALSVVALAYPAKSRAQDTVYGLQKSGWVIVKKTESDEWRKGAPPYGKLDRLVYVVIYTLEKDGKTMTCTLTRDMMFDTSEQTCVRLK